MQLRVVMCSFHQLPSSFLPHVVFGAFCLICKSQIPAGETQETPAATQPKTSKSQVHLRVPQLTEWPRGLLKVRYSSSSEIEFLTTHREGEEANAAESEIFFLES